MNRLTWTTAIFVNCWLLGCGGVSSPAGDAGTEIQSCTSLPTPPALNACAQPVIGWTDTSFTATHSLTISGTVTAVAQGPVAGGCLAAPLVDSGSSITALTVRASADGGIDDFDVEYQVPNSGVVWAVGDPVNLSYAKSGGGWSPEIVSLTLSHGQMVDVYVGRGGGVRDFSVVPFTFVQGRARCTQTDTCGSWSPYDLEIQDNNGNTNVPYATTVTVNGYRVIHGGVSEQLSQTTQCADWYVANANVAVLRDATSN